MPWFQISEHQRVKMEWLIEARDEDDAREQFLDSTAPLFIVTQSVEDSDGLTVETWDGPAPSPDLAGHVTDAAADLLASLRAMPGPIRLFLAYALILLAGIGLSLRFVVDMAISAPVSLPGVVVMVLLAYTIFTITLVLQRKEAARTLALGLSSLTIPPIPWAIVVGQPIVAIFFASLALLLLRGLRRPEVATYLIEP